MNEWFVSMVIGTCLLKLLPCWRFETLLPIANIFGLGNWGGGRELGLTLVCVSVYLTVSLYSLGPL